MTATSRRIFVYWLLLLAAALGVGVGAWLLLEREESRLLQRTESAEAARRAAVGARANLVAENVELLVGDVEAGLLDTLTEAPVDDLAVFLNDWEKSNPLVRTAFLARDDGQLLRPSASSGDDDARGFRRRFATRFAQRPPWTEAEIQSVQKQSSKPSAAEMDMTEARKAVESNVSSLQNARREVQALAKDRSAYASNAPAPAASAESSYAKKETTRSSGAAVGLAQEAKKALAPVIPERRGWVPLTAEGRLHLLGWVKPAGAVEVRGVEVELTALISRLGGSMPADVQTGEGYALRDDKGRIQHQAGTVPTEGTFTPSARVALASSLLPGWDVVAFLMPAQAENDGSSFFAIGLLLTAVLVMAILTSGSLLLWQARRSEREAAQKTSFVANVSHEFKTPLTTIRLYSELLEQGRVSDGEKQSEYLRTIGRETQRLARLVNNALDFSRLEEGKKTFQRERCDLGAEVTRLLGVHAPRLAEAGLELVRVMPAQPLLVVTDRDALEQIVLNLVDNACKYAAGGGEIHVEAQAREAGEVELRVGDRGPGVPLAERERVFEKFHRVDQTLTAERGGTGLGLSIARQLARGLGGELRCEERAGGGAVFVLTLP